MIFSFIILHSLRRAILWTKVLCDSFDCLIANGSDMGEVKLCSEVMRMRHVTIQGTLNTQS